MARGFQKGTMNEKGNVCKRTPCNKLSLKTQFSLPLGSSSGENEYRRKVHCRHITTYIHKIFLTT